MVMGEQRGAHIELIGRDKRRTAAGCQDDRSATASHAAYRSSRFR